MICNRENIETELNELRAQLAVATITKGMLKEIVRSLATKESVLKYLIKKGAELPGFQGLDLSLDAEETLAKKQLVKAVQLNKLS